MSDETTAPAADENTPAEQPAEAPTEEPAEPAAEEAEAEAAAEEGDHPRKAELTELLKSKILAGEAELTHELLDSLEKRSAVHDLRFLVAYVRKSL